MPHSVDIVIWKLVFHPVRNLDANYDDQEQNTCEQQMSLNDSFNPTLELILALNIEACIIVLSTLGIILI